MTIKTDQKDARGIAQIIRTGWYRTVHVKTPASQELRMLLTSRKFVVRRLVDLKNEIRGILRGFGLKVGKVGNVGFEARVRELVAHKPRQRAGVEALLRARAALLAEYDILHRMVLRAARKDAICRRLTTIPGVGAVIALTYRCAVDEPSRFTSPGYSFSMASGRAAGALDRLAVCYSSAQVRNGARISGRGCLL